MHRSLLPALLALASTNSLCPLGAWEGDCLWFTGFGAGTYTDTCCICWCMCRVHSALKQHPNLIFKQCVAFSGALLHSFTLSPGCHTQCATVCTVCCARIWKTDTNTLLSFGSPTVMYTRSVLAYSSICPLHLPVPHHLMPLELNCINSIMLSSSSFTVHLLAGQGDSVLPLQGCPYEFRTNSF